ncbi:fatty acid--CoA ligase [Parerythrobacter jejuensis]|uniref:3-methylmercaptopropionyl-CoA ligase n=1 Tax=Parerythrobacter jejuensis TaxID=795812 RepID=A0A845AN04_9SPHN|nr:fatty acid--CoA ligase [Parerythrobacter jejuensis]MXP30241.1 long-chain-fatty-acid--CoA ligase [Parerythrobacter jejuensis]MXP33001.1 long-chain-fatty-acid--CoA ligase [Parerythrobacter jejuensis]
MADTVLEIAEAETVTEVVRLHAINTPDTAAFTFEDQEITFAELDAGSNRAAQGLMSLGVQRGDRIAYLGKNHPLYFEILIGAAKIGAVMTPVNWRLAAPEVAYILDNCGAQVAFVGAGFAEMMEKARPDAPRLSHVIGLEATGETATDYCEWRDSFPADNPGVHLGAGDDLLQLYTSGTTGRPKGAVMTHGSILSSRDSTGRDGGLRPWQEPVEGDVTLLAMPCFHISGTGTGIGTMVAGTNAIVLPEYDPTQALDLIENYNISKIFLVPAAIQIMLNHPRVAEVDFSRLKFITYGASPIPLELMKAAMERFGCGFVQMYGMTETSGTIVALDPEDHRPEGSPKMRSVGTPLQGVEIKIIDDDGNTVAANTVGEIATRSSKNMSRYWNNPDATASTIDPEGWLRTGDAGYLDEDGYLYIHDRVKDMIISGGENIYPAEVENAVYSHPKVADVAVIGVPDEKWGEAVKACVVVKDGEEVTEPEIIAHCREHIAGYKCPKSIDFIEALPRNPSGKVLRRELRAPYWEGKERAVN